MLSGEIPLLSGVVVLSFPRLSFEGMRSFLYFSDLFILGHVGLGPLAIYREFIK